MVEDSPKHSDVTPAEWAPLIRVEDAFFEEGGYLLMSVDFEGEAPVNPKFVYRWKSTSGIESDETRVQRVPTFLFYPPHEGRFLMGVDVTDDQGVTRSAEQWATAGEGEGEEEGFFVRPEIPDDSVEPVVIVDDVSMVFNMASEQFNSLKEYFIALARGVLSFKPFRALNHISFTVRRGEAFGLVGTNGSGKSTMLKIIAGVLEASEGTCEVVGSIAPLIELGAGFDIELTARENIYLNGALLGYRKEFIDEHFDEIISFAELENFKDLPLKNFSSGMVARIAFAIATAAEPDILIVDETLSVGDFLFQRKCEKRIQELVSSGRVTVLFVSHSMDLVQRLCDRVCWIEKGQQRMLGPTDEVCEAYRNLKG